MVPRSLTTMSERTKFEKEGMSRLHRSTDIAHEIHGSRQDELVLVVLTEMLRDGSCGSSWQPARVSAG